ncbi:MAG: MBL fold metallo-hydrolase [Clostridium sp.]|nr:MBL fold metallo-hydrolase [Clostridium sp.]
MTTVKRIRCGAVNCFLIVDGDDAVLVDTGTLPYKDKVDEECSKVNLSLIVLTHGHIDHTQNAQYLSKKYHVPIAIHKLEYPYTKDYQQKSLKAHTLIGKYILWKSMLAIKKSNKITNGNKEKGVPGFCTCSVFLKDGMSLADYGVDATVVRLSGHTRGSIGVKVGTRDFIVGDALMNIGIPSVTRLYGDYDKVRQSAQVISQSGERMIHFGHGKSVKNRFWKA